MLVKQVSKNDVVEVYVKSPVNKEEVVAKQVGHIGGPHVAPLKAVLLLEESICQRPPGEGGRHMAEVVAHHREVGEALLSVVVGYRHGQLIGEEQHGVLPVMGQHRANVRKVVGW